MAKKNASVNYYPINRHKYNGFYWSCSTNEEFGIKFRNTAAEKQIYTTIEDAKEACKEYILQCLNKPKSEQWPKELTIYVHNEKYDSLVAEWLKEQGLDFDSPFGQKLSRIAYELELRYLVNEDGTYKLTHVDNVELRS